MRIIANLAVTAVICLASGIAFSQTPQQYGLDIVATPALNLENFRPRGSIPLFSSQHARLYADGTLELSASPQEAAREFFAGVGEDRTCFYDSPTGPKKYPYVLMFEGVLPQLNHYAWQIGITPDGDVKYENIQPSPEADAYFRAIAETLKCR